MQFKLALVATLLSGISLAKDIELEGYKGDSCSNSNLSGYLISAADGCVNLNQATKSFHIGGPTTQRQLAKGCTVHAYTEKGCKGQGAGKIVGPSSASKCYPASHAAKSVKITC